MSDGAGPAEAEREESNGGPGVEEEDQGTPERPFDPSGIRVRTVVVTVGQLVSRIEHDEIDLAPDFQRAAGIWKQEQKSRLIESLLLRIPIAVFYVAADEDEKWTVVDGIQRLSTMNDFVTGRFPLSRLEYRADFNGRRHDELPRAMQRRISETQLGVHVIEPGTPSEVMFNIFRRINTGGIRLNGQEIRHALNPGPIRAFLRELAEADEFLAATRGSVSPKRMADRECVLRFLAFRIAPWEDYRSDSLDEHLAGAIRRINAMTPSQRDSLAADFRKAMRAAARIFGDDAFRKPHRRGESRKPISKPLFEAWGVQLARCSPEDIDRLAERQKRVRGGFQALVREDPEFDSAISSSTGTPKRIRKRFAAIRDLVEEALRC